MISLFIFTRDIFPLISEEPENVRQIWSYCAGPISRSQAKRLAHRLEEFEAVSDFR